MVAMERMETHGRQARKSRTVLTPITTLSSSDGRKVAQDKIDLTTVVNLSRCKSPPSGRYLPT